MGRSCRTWLLACCWLLLSASVLAQHPSSANSGANTQSYSDELRHIERLLESSIASSLELEGRLSERTLQLASLNESLRKLEREHGEQSNELEQLRALQRELSKELIALRIELERSRRRSDIYWKLVQQLRADLKETQSSLESSQATSEQLSSDFDELEKESSRQIRRSWIRGAAVGGAVGIALTLLAAALF